MIREYIYIYFKTNEQFLDWRLFQVHNIQGPYKIQINAKEII